MYMAFLDNAHMLCTSSFTMLLLGYSPWTARLLLRHRFLNLQRGTHPTNLEVPGNNVVEGCKAFSSTSQCTPGKFMEVPVSDGVLRLVVVVVAQCVCSSSICGL